MKTRVHKHLKDRTKADVLIVPFWQGKKQAEPVVDVKEYASLYATPLQMGDFLGKQGEILTLYTENQKEPRLLLLGLGERSKYSDESLRCAFSNAVKWSLKRKWVDLNVLIADASHETAIIEGILLTNYHYMKLKGISLKENPHVSLNQVNFIGMSEDALVKERQVVIDAVNFTRDLVNGNADDIHADSLASFAKNIASSFSRVRVRILRRKELQEEKMGLLLAVSRGSSMEPALIIMEYKGDPKSSEVTALVGKGVTYDTGGLNIKPTGSMETMKCDMAGAATVLGTMQAAAQLGLKKNIIGVIAAAENAIGPDSYKPGDVYSSHAGITVEITNTDAEGRLVLADALSFLQSEYKPTRIVDLATLTGGIVVALGEDLTGLFSNDENLAAQLLLAGTKTHERLWRMPILAEYKEKMKSPIADIKNSAGRQASSSTAAYFLSRFVKEVPWAHLDIAGTAYLSEPKHYNQTPATGVGVRLLIELLSNN